MALSNAQAKVAHDNSRFKVLITGRRFGKTHLALREIAKFAAIPDSLVLYCAPSYRMAKNIMWRKIKKKLLSLFVVTKGSKGVSFILMSSLFLRQIRV